MSDTVIKVENLSKQYRIGAREGYKTFRETLVDAAKAPIQPVQKLFNSKSDYIWVLRSSVKRSSIALTHCSLSYAQQLTKSMMQPEV